MGFRLDTPQPGFDFHVAVGDDPSSLIAEAEASPAYVAPDADRSLAPRTGRYVLVWITSVVAIGDGSNRAEISEIRVLGS
jgi:hypothetical protein